MTREELSKIERKTPAEITADIMNTSRVQDIQIAVECAMNQEWWRGYHAALDHVDEIDHGQTEGEPPQ